MTTAVPIGARVDKWRSVLAVDGVEPIVCMTKSGGAVEAEETRTRAGGGLPERSIGGRTTHESVTVSVTLAGGADPAHYRALRRAVERDARATVTEAPLDADGNVFGPHQLTYSGTIRRVGGLEHDANGSDASTFEVEIATDGAA